jgi:hypothetical protein
MSGEHHMLAAFLLGEGALIIAQKAGWAPQQSGHNGIEKNLLTWQELTQNTDYTFTTCLIRSVSKLFMSENYIFQARRWHRVSTSNTAEVD